MPIHDWTRVDAGIVHDFHVEWILATKRALNHGVLPRGYYAMAEQRAGVFSPDVLTLERRGDFMSRESAEGGLLLAPPRPRIAAETAAGFYRRKQNRVVIRHVSDDSPVAFVEIISPGNKSSRLALGSFVEKATATFLTGIHLLVIDIHPPGRLDPGGMHGAIWDAWAGETYEAPPGEPLTVVSYEADDSIRAYIEPAAVGAELRDVPLFLETGGCVMVPMEVIYREAFAEVPPHWQDVLQLPV